MKQLISYKETTAILHHKGVDHAFTRTGGMLVLTQSEIDNLSEVIALLLILISGSRLIFIEKKNYYAIRDKCWTLVDFVKGGLTPVGLAIYGEDEAVAEAAALHKAAVAQHKKG